MNLPSILKKSKDKNINLLTEDEAAYRSVKRNVLIILSIPLLVVIFLLIVFAALFIFEQSEVLRSRDIANKITDQETQWQGFSDTASSIKHIKTALDTHKDQTKQNKEILDSTTSIRSVIPNTVTLQKMDVKEGGEAAIDGTSSDPRAIFQLLTLLNNKSEVFTDVSLQSIGFSSGDNQKKKNLYNFSVGFKVKVE